MLKNDWVVSLRFDKERLQVVQCRLIVAGEAEGRYCGLNEDERSQAFDYLCSLLDSYVKSEGQIQTAEDMKLYVKEKTNMLVFKDDQQQCVGLTMFF